jgi:hypothetical protein
MKTETSIHDIASIEILERRFYANAGRPFWNREILITDKEGNQHSLQLYAYGEEDEIILKVAL